MYEREASGLERIAAQSGMTCRQAVRYAVLCLLYPARVRCPGCGDSGDLAHMQTCCQNRLSERGELYGRRAGAQEVIDMVCKMIDRRGEVMVGKLRDAVRSWR